MPKQYGKLREEIGRKFDIQPEFAKAMDMSTTTLNNKLNGKTEWKISEIAKAMQVLNLPYSALEEYFFYS